VSRFLTHRLALIAVLGVAAVAVAGIGIAFASTGAEAQSSKAKGTKGKRGPKGAQGARGAQGPQGTSGAAGPAGPAGPAGATGQGIPLLYEAPANSAVQVLFNQRGLQIEASCSGTKVTTLTGRSKADHGVIRASDVVSGSISKSDDFASNTTINLTPGGVANNYVLTFLSAGGPVVTGIYGTANGGGGGAGTNTIADCLAFGSLSLP
jgi:hypothetical protein